MKVYLINPPAPNGVQIVREGRCMQRKGAWTSVWSPISLALCAGVLEKHGFEVKISDCIVEDIDFSLLKKKIASFKPSLVVINTATPSIESDLSVCDLVKKIDKNIVTAVFGIHVTALPGDTLKSQKSLDVVIKGEPEITVLELAENLKAKKNIHKMAGISFRTGLKIYHNVDRPMMKDLDELPFPAWHLIDKNNYIMPFTDRPFFLVATSRGCPYRCTFCADKTYYGQKLRLRSAKSIVDELEYNQQKFNVSDFLFWAESFTINQNFSQEVCEEIIQRGLKVRFVCNSRVDAVNLKMLKKFKQAGCWMIGFGIESGNQRILNLAHKGITLKQIKEATFLSKKAGLQVTGHCVVGLPGETKDTILQTTRFIKGLGLDFAQFYCAVPFPGSELHQMAQSQGWIASTDWSKYEQNFSVLNYEDINAEEIMSLRQQAYRSFYLSPQQIVKTVMRIRSPQEFLNFISMARGFWNWVR